MRRIVLGGLVAIAACNGTGGDATIDLVHDVCAPLAVTSDTSTPLATAGIDGAFGLWSTHGAANLAWRDTTHATVPTLAIRFEAASPAFHGVYDDETGVIYINTAIKDPDALAIVIAHELGHAMGLVHVDDRPSLMNPGNTTLGPQPSDAAELTALWGACE